MPISKPLPATQLRASSFDVARLAGVSRSAVSRTFTPGGSVSEATREKVIRAAKQLGYHPNAIARTLTTRRSNMMAVIAADLDNPFYAKAISCLSSGLQMHGYTMLLLVAERSKFVDELVPRLLSYQIDGIVVASATYSSIVTEYCLAAGLPLVQFNRYTAFEGASTVQSDNFAGGMMAAQALADAGHERIAFVAGTEDTSSSVDRERGFKEGLARYGMTITARASGEYSYIGGRDAATKLLSSNYSIDAAFCANDLMAIGFIDSAMERGLTIPKDLSVVGFDNSPFAGLAHYNLTTIDQNINLMATEAIDILLSAIDGRVQHPQMRTIPCHLVVRSSVRNTVASQGNEHAAHAVRSSAQPKHVDSA